MPAALDPARAAPGWFACAALCAALADACATPERPPLGEGRWIEGAALFGLLAALVRRRGERGAASWRTPLDGRIAAVLAVMLLAAAPWWGGAPDAAELRLVLACVACFYALSALVARDGRAIEAAWHAFPLAAAALGLHALWGATSGLANLAALSASADAAWGAPHALDSALLFATMLTLGRAAERGATPRWRLAGVVGTIGVVLHAAASGLPFDTRSLARLEAPLDFSAAMVMTLLLHRMGRHAWTLARERNGQAARWWGAVAAVVVLGAGLLYGSGPVGEGLVVLAVLAASVIAAAPSVPIAVVTPVAERPAPLSRAA